MELLELPTEIFDQILRDAFLERTFDRGLRLRLVNKLFSDRIVRIVFENRLADSQLARLARAGRPCQQPFAIDYLAFWVMHEPPKGRPLLLLFRRIIDKLTNLQTGVVTQTTITILCSQVAKYGDLGRLFDRCFPAPNETQFDKELLIAAIATSNFLVAKKLVDQGYCARRRSKLFGYAPQFEIHHDTTELLDLMPGGLEHEIDRSIEYAGCETVKYLFEAHISRSRVDAGNDWCWDFDEAQYRRNRKLDAWLFTPDVNTYEFVMSLRQNTKRWNGPVPPYLQDSLLYKCAGKGWVEMARRLLDLGVPIECPSRRLTPLVRACMNGHIEVASLFLEKGADPKGALQMAAKNCHQDIVGLLLLREKDVSGAVIEQPAARGNVALVRMLLDHGADPNIGSPHPLVSAIVLEHTAMFRFLLERGAILTQRIAGECIEVAERDGLESMLALLEEHKEDLDEQ